MVQGNGGKPQTDRTPDRGLWRQSDFGSSTGKGAGDCFEYPAGSLVKPLNLFGRAVRKNRISAVEKIHEFSLPKTIGSMNAVKFTNFTSHFIWRI